MSPTGIEIDFFHCPDWGIGAPRIDVYYNVEYNFTICTISTDHNVIDLPFKRAVTATMSECDSLSTGMVSPDPGLYHIFHILVTFDTEPIPIDWVYVGEVRFLGLSDEGDGYLLCIMAVCILYDTIPDTCMTAISTPTDSVTSSSTNILSESSHCSV